jgi:hypothetical protein
MATQKNIQNAINLLAKEQDSEIRWSFSHTINNQTDNAKENLKASAKAKLMAGEALTEDEANVMIGG